MPRIRLPLLASSTWYVFRIRAEQHNLTIIQADASNVTKEGYNQFSFKAGSHQHRFEATKAEERDSWVVAIEKAIEEAKALKEEVTGRESYKKNVEEYCKWASSVTVPGPANDRRLMPL